MSLIKPFVTIKFFPLSKKKGKPCHTALLTSEYQWCHLDFIFNTHIVVREL